MDVQNTPVTQGIDINVGDVQNMPLEQIAPKYEEMSNKFNEMGQNIVRDIAGRQSQLIGRSFSWPSEGAIGDYNENTYITPAVTNAQSSIRQIGASVALQEGMRRGEEAAKKRLKDAQDKYNKWVKEMNRRAAAAAEAQRAAAQKAAQQQRVAQSQIDPEYLKKKGLTADDFVSMSAAQKEQFYKDYYDSKIGVNWGDKNKWNEVKNQVYNALGASQEQRQDKSTGNQSQASKDFWASKAATDKFHEIWYSSYGDGKQIYQGRGTFVTKMKEAVNTFFNPQTPEQRKASFDQILKTVSLEIPALKKVQESTAGDRETEMRRYDQMNRDMARKNLSSDEVREMNREYLKVYKGQEDTQRLSELLNKAGAANPTKAHNKVVSVDKSVVTPAQLLENLFGLDKGELESLRKFKLEEPDKFNRVTNEIMDIRMGDFVHYSDGNPDNMDNYRFNKETNSFDLAPAGTTIVKVAPGAQEDADLKDVMNLYKDPILLKKIRENPDSEEAKQYSKKLNKFAKTQSDSLMAGAMYDTVTGSSLYNALKYDPSNSEDKKMNIRGKKISEYLKEFNSLSNEDFSKRVRELLTLANSERGFFLDKEGNKLSMNRADGAPLIGGKGNLDFSPEEAAALFTVIKKEAEAGNMRDQRFGAGEGTDLEVVERTAKNFRNSMKLAEGVANVVGAFFTIPFSNVSQGFQDNARKAFGEMGEAKKGEWGYGVDLRTSQYDAFRNLMEMQHSTKNGWLGQGTDFWTDVKRGAGEGVAFVADMVAPTVAFGAAKSLAVAAGKSLAQRATVQIAEKVAKQMAEKAGLSFERAAISNADDVLENVGKTLTKDGYIASRSSKLEASHPLAERLQPISEVKAPQEALERVTGHVLKGQSDDVAEKISKESISTKSTSEFIETGAKPAVTKGLAYDDPLWGSINKVSQDVARITTQRGDVMKYLKNYDHKIFGYKTREELFQDIDKATKGMAFRNTASRKQYVGALKNRVDLLRQSFGEHTALMTAGIRAESIANASPSAIRAAVQILSGREGFFTIKKVSEATTRAGMSMARTARKLGQDTDTWKVFAQRKDLAEKLIDKAAAMGKNGKKMGTSDVLRFMAKEVGDKGARYRIFAQRFLKNEAIGNAMWAQYELKNSPENLSSADYIMQNVVGGTAISMAMTGLGGAWLRRNISKTNTQLQKQAEILSRNAQDVTSPAYQKAANKITELHNRAQMLADKSMDMSHSNYVVAEARKAADDAKATIQEHLASLSDTEFGKIAQKATAHSGKAVKDKLNATMPYSYRMMNALSSMRAAAGVRWAQYSKELPNLFALDAKASAKITAEVYEKAIKGATFEEKRKIAVDTVAENLVAMRGVSKPVAKREAEYLFSEYDNMWARAEKSGIDIKSFGGDKRAVYLSPAGITSIKGDTPDAYLGLATKRKITSEVSNPVIERADDHGKAARSFLETGKTSVNGGISVTNPDGFNLVVSLNAYANRLESKMSLESIENNVLKNGDVVIKGEKNLTAAVEADKTYYKNLVDVEKAGMKGYEDEIKEIASKQKALAGKLDDAHITNTVEKVELAGKQKERIQTELEALRTEAANTPVPYETVARDNLGTRYKVTREATVKEIKNIEKNRLVNAIETSLLKRSGLDKGSIVPILKFGAEEFNKAKGQILRGEEPAGWVRRYLTQSGDYGETALAALFQEVGYKIKYSPKTKEYLAGLKKDPAGTLKKVFTEKTPRKAPEKKILAPAAVEQKSDQVLSMNVGVGDPKSLREFKKQVGVDSPRINRLYSDAQKAFAGLEGDVSVSDIWDYVLERTPIGTGKKNSFGMKNAITQRKELESAVSRMGNTTESLVKDLELKPEKFTKGSYKGLDEADVLANRKKAVEMLDDALSQERDNFLNRIDAYHKEVSEGGETLVNEAGVVENVVDDKTGALVGTKSNAVMADDAVYEFNNLPLDVKNQAVKDWLDAVESKLPEKGANIGKHKEAVWENRIENLYDILAESDLQLHGREKMTNRATPPAEYFSTANKPSVKNRSGYNFIDATDVLSARINELESRELQDLFSTEMENFTDDILRGDYVDEREIAPLIKRTLEESEGKPGHDKFLKELDGVGVHRDDLDRLVVEKTDPDAVFHADEYAASRYEDDPRFREEDSLSGYLDRRRSPEEYLPGSFYEALHPERGSGLDILPLSTQRKIAEDNIRDAVEGKISAKIKELEAAKEAELSAMKELKQEASRKNSYYKTSPEQAKAALDEIRALGKKIEAITSSSGFKASQKRLEDATEAYNRVLSGEGASAYTNRFGTTFLADANNLNGYSEARSILDVSVAQSTREGFHPIENRRIRKENRQLKSIGEKSFNERQNTYGHLKDSIRKSIDPALGDIADEDILASHGWAQMMAVSNSEFSKSQGVYQAMMKLAGFNKQIQSLQLAGGISYFNAFTFRQALSALMTDPGSLPTFIKSFFDARSSRSVADFFRANQDRITEVTLSTGDPFYMDSLIDMVSRDRGYSTNVTQDIIDSWKSNKYDVVMKRTPKENGKLKPGEPMYDVTTSQAVESGKASRLADAIEGTVNRIFEEPTFKRYIPVLQTAMYLRNLDRAHWALRSALNIPVGKPLEDRETDLVVKLAHARTKLFWHPIKTVGNSKNLLIPKKSGAMSADMAVRANYESMIDDYVARGGKLSSKQVLTSFFFALDYKATMMGRMLNGLQGFARPHNFVYGGARKDVMAMMGVIGAAVLWNAQNGYETAFDNPDKLLSNLNNLGKFRLGDDKGSAVIDPFFSQFTLVNSAMRGTRGMLGYEGGTDTGNMNAQRGTRFKIGNWHIGDFGPLNPISDEMATNLLNPYKSVYELFTNNTFFGNNIYEHPTLPNGQPNPNYNLYRNIGASIQHLLNFDTTNEWVKGANTIGDKTGQVGGSGLVQHPFMEAYKAWKNGDYGAALFKVMEMPLKYESLAGEARTSLNTYVLKGISQQKEVYDQVVRDNPGNKEKIDKAYGDYVKNSIKLINDWNDKWKAFKKDPKLLAAANNILVGFFSGEYDDNLKKMQTAYWKASIDSQMGGDFGFDKKENETEEQYVERKNKSYEFYAKQLDKEYEARQTLKKYGWKVEDKAFEDAEIEYKNTNKAVAAQVDAVLNGKIAGFKNFAEMKANYESRIKNLDNLYDVFDAKGAKKLREKKAALAEEYNKQLFDALAPFVDKYGVDILNYPANKGGFMETEISKLVLVPANKFYNGKDPQKSYLKDQFGVGYRNNTALPSDAEVQKRFLQVQNILKAGRFAQANSKLDSLIEDIRKGRVGVAGRDWAKIVHYKALFDSKSY